MWMDSMRGIQTLWEKRVFCNCPCNSLYLYVVNVNRQICIWCNSLQLYQNNSFSTTMQLYYNYTHDVMLMSLIVIHLLKSNMWHYEFFWHIYIQNIDLHRSLWLLMMVQNFDPCHNKKWPHGIWIIFWNK